MFLLTSINDYRSNFSKLFTTSRAGNLKHETPQIPGVTKYLSTYTTHQANRICRFGFTWLFHGVISRTFVVYVASKDIRHENYEVTAESSHHLQGEHKFFP